MMRLRWLWRWCPCGDCRAHREQLKVSRMNFSARRAYELEKKLDASLDDFDWSGWTFSQYTADNAEQNRCLWISNGLCSFKDYGNGQRTLLGLSFKQRRRLWNSLQREIRARLVQESIA